MTNWERERLLEMTDIGPDRCPKCLELVRSKCVCDVETFPLAVSPAVMTPEAFAALCRELRELGASEVDAGGFRAKFGPLPRAMTTPTVRPVPAGFATEEQTEEWRERAKRGH